MHANSLPKSVKAQFGANQKTFAMREAKSISGASPKGCYLDEAKQMYFGKISKLRDAKTIFSTALSKVSTPVNLNEKVYQQHLQELSDSQLFLQVLAPRIAKSIFGEHIIVPDNYFCKLPNGVPMILSELIPGFNEFLSNEKMVKGVQEKKRPADWNVAQLPKREDISLTEKQANILGKLLCVGLVMGHWDVLNNINLTNSGVVDKNGQLILAVVDWGNCLGTGFSGLPADVNAFDNPDIKTKQIDSKSSSLEGFQHCVPFDEIVYPLLPRQVIKNLFDLHASDATSKAVLSGFKEAYTEAKKQVDQLAENIPLIVHETLEKFTALADRVYATSLLNRDVYLSKSENSETYTLANVLCGRIRSIEGILQGIEVGKSLDDIAQERLSDIIDSQTPPLMHSPQRLFTPRAAETQSSSSVVVGLFTPRF